MQGELKSSDPVSVVPECSRPVTMARRPCVDDWLKLISVSYLMILEPWPVLSIRVSKAMFQSIFNEMNNMKATELVRRWVDNKNMSFRCIDDVTHSVSVFLCSMTAAVRVG